MLCGSHKLSKVLIEHVIELIMRLERELSKRAAFQDIPHTVAVESQLILSGLFLVSLSHQFVPLGILTRDMLEAVTKIMSAKVSFVTSVGMTCSNLVRVLSTWGFIVKSRQCLEAAASYH